VTMIPGIEGPVVRSVINRYVAAVCVPSDGGGFAGNAGMALLDVRTAVGT